MKIGVASRLIINVFSGVWYFGIERFVCEHIFPIGSVACVL